MRGPQASGLVLGRKDLLQVAFLNGAPHHSLARPMKAGKEEIMGLLAAVEQWIGLDHEVEWKEWEQWLQHIAAAVTQFESVETTTNLPGRSNVAPVLAISWDPEVVRVSPQEVERQLSAGDPRIEVSGHNAGISIMSYVMEPGEEQIVAQRLEEIMTAAVD